MLISREDRKASRFAHLWKITGVTGAITKFRVEPKQQVPVSLLSSECYTAEILQRALVLYQL